MHEAYNDPYEHMVEIIVGDFSVLLWLSISKNMAIGKILETQISPLHTVRGRLTLKRCPVFLEQVHPRTPVMVVLKSCISKSQNKNFRK